MLEQGASYAKLLVRWQHQDLRNGQRGLGNFEELVEDSGIGDELVVHVNEEVVPEGVQRDA